MEPGEIISQARDVLTVRRVYGEPLEKDGVTLIPTAAVRGMGGFGGGEGTGDQGGGKGGGGGFNVRARPVGAYVIEGGRVTWVPALDLTRIIAGGQAVAMVLLLTIRVLLRRRSRR